MPPSPALRFSPGREPREENSHKPGRSLEIGLLFREKDDDLDLALFNEMHSKERDSFLLQNSDDLDDTFSTKLRHFADAKCGISIPGRETSELLNAYGDKNDYDWLLTPPDTPLFPSLDDEPPLMNVASRGRPHNKSILVSRSSMMEKGYRSSRGSASPNCLSLSPCSGTNTLQSRGRLSSVRNSSPTPSLQVPTPSRRPSPPPNKPKTPASRSNNSTPGRMSTGSSGPVVSSGIRGTSPIRKSRGNSASPKIRALQTNVPGFSSEAPPSLRTSLADQPESYLRGSSPASRNGRDTTSKSSRQSMSPTLSRSSSSFCSHDRDQFSTRCKGSVTSSGDDDSESLQSILVSSLDRQGSIRSGSLSTNRTPTFSKKSARTGSPNFALKRLFDSAIRPMDRKSPQDMFRPLLSSVPSTMSYVGKVNSAHHSLVSRNSSVTTNINASSDQGTSFAVDTQGSDHNHDDMASETDKILYHDIHEELFAFDKIDELNANGESIDIQHNETRDPKIVFGPTESEHSVRHGGIDAEVNENSETSCNQGDIYETGNSENTAICSHCGCSYEATEQDEKDVALCPECSRKLLRVIIPETTLAVSKDSSLISKYIPEEEKSLSLSETNQLTVASELPQDTDVGDLRFRFGEQDAEECQTSCSELIHDHSQNSPLPSSSEGGVEMNRPGVDYEKANNEFGDQKLYRYSAPPNFNVNLKEGSDFSVLLHRSSSNQGPELQQGRSFTATTMSYDDLSLARDSKNSNRSSRRDGSYSASSSVDYGSVRHTELRVQRLLSGRKLDVDCGYDLQVKPPSTGSSFSGTSNHSHHELVLATREISGDIECGFVEDIPGIIRGMQASEITVIDVTDASSVSLIGVKEDKFELDDTRRPTNACSSEISIRTAVVQSDDNSVASFPNLGDCISYEKVEDDPNNLSVSSFHEKRDVLNSYVDVRDALVTTNSCTIVESEIEGGKNYCENNTGTVNDDMSLVEKSALDECQELSAQNPSNDCLTASVSEVNTSKYSHGIEGVTITAECQGAGNTRSLTLEEATDTILFCSSIIHDLAHQAASTALEKEYSDDPFEGSQPAMTLLGKSNSNREDTHSRVVCKHASKLHKAKQRRVVENNVKPSSGMTKNDENIDESFTHDNNDGLPEKVDSNMKLPKLESKCSCIIM